MLNNDISNESKKNDIYDDVHDDVYIIRFGKIICTVVGSTRS